MKFARLDDRVETDAAQGPLDLSAFPGTWVNSNPETQGIARLTMSVSDGILSIGVRALGPDGLIDWGPAQSVEIFTAGPSSRVGLGFTCEYDFGFAETRLEAMIAKGLTVLGQFHHFKDDSSRMDYFTREYFAKTHDRY